MRRITGALSLTRGDSQEFRVCFARYDAGRLGQMLCELHNVCDGVTCSTIFLAAMSCRCRRWPGVVAKSTPQTSVHFQIAVIASSLVDALQQWSFDYDSFCRA